MYEPDLICSRPHNFIPAMGLHSTLCALFVLPLACAQFPAVCNTQDSLSTKTCCPDNCGTHGTCVSIREEVERSWQSANATIVDTLRGVLGQQQDVRYQWPLNVFERVCSCDEGWGGYGCNRCEFGFVAANAEECVRRNASQLLVRRNFANLGEQDRLDLIRLMEAAKNEEIKEWAVITSVPEESNDRCILQNVSTYDMMVLTHYLSVREKESTYCPPFELPNDTNIEIMFAHWGTPFLPWHRYFTLHFESELRRIGEKLGINNFTLPYWDWTPASNCLIFTHTLFGTPEHNDKAVNVSGTLFENGKWPVVCDLMYRARAAGEVVTSNDTKCAKVRTVCDIDSDRSANRRLQRGAWLELIRNLWLPDYKLISMTLSPDQFEGTFGFSNRLEGLLEQCASETVKCMYVHYKSNMHGSVNGHVGGHLSVRASGANDPILFLHHANVDRIFERWLQKYNGTPPSYQPINGGPPGHNLNDYLVPMFPLKKIADFYKESQELGYIYDDLPWSIPSTDYQAGCPGDQEQCDKGGYPPTVLANTNSAYCTQVGMVHQSLVGGE